MFIQLNSDTNEAIHNLINLHLFPERALRLGQFDECEWHDAEVHWERIGSPYQYGARAITYNYHVVGDGFALQLLAVWADEDQATARVHVVAIDDDASEALGDWLARVVTGRRPPRDQLDNLVLN